MPDTTPNVPSALLIPLYEWIDEHAAKGMAKFQAEMALAFATYVMETATQSAIDRDPRRAEGGTSIPPSAGSSTSAMTTTATNGGDRG